VAVAVELITAGASVATALAIPPLVPKTLDLLERARESNSRKEQLDSLAAKLLAQKATRMSSCEWSVPSGTLKWSDEMAALHGITQSA